MADGPTIHQVARDLVAWCREGKDQQVLNTYYADDIVSVEGMDSPEMPAEKRGKDAVKAKWQWWYDNHEVHSIEVGEPYVGYNKFAVRFTLDITSKQCNERMKMSEIAVYTVEGGKIIREDFLYDASCFPPPDEPA